MKSVILAVATLVAATPSFAFAQSGGQKEIIVTAYKRSEDLQVVPFAAVTSIDSRTPPPHVAMPKRADFAIVTLNVSSDTPNRAKRLAELRDGLATLESRTKGTAISLRLLDERAGIVRDFSIVAAMAALPDHEEYNSTSSLQILVRTPISVDDTLGAIHKRISDFVTAAPKPGRVAMEEGGLELTLVEPEQYRPVLLAAITADGKGVVAPFGDGYGMIVLGAQNRVAWERTGDLDLSLYIPYALEVSVLRTR